MNVHAKELTMINKIFSGMHCNVALALLGSQEVKHTSWSETEDMRSFLDSIPCNSVSYHIEPPTIDILFLAHLTIINNTVLVVMQYGLK